MPWQEVSMMDQRREFVMFASREGAAISAQIHPASRSPAAAHRNRGEFQPLMH